MQDDGSPIVDDALSFLSTRLAESGNAAGYMIDARHVSPAILKRHWVGYYSAIGLDVALRAKGHKPAAIHASGLIRRSFEDWLCFPWFDAAGRLHGMVFRALPWHDAGQNRFGKPVRWAFCGNRDALPLYGLEATLQHGHQHLVVVEGTIDMLALHSAGLTHVVAANSCQLRVWHARDLLAQGVTDVTLCFDADEAGRRGTMRTLEACAAVELTAHVAPDLQPGEDPDDMARRVGKPAMLAHFNSARDGLGYAAEQILGGHGAASDGRAACLKEAAEFHTVRAPGRSDADLRQRFWPPLAAALRLSSHEIDDAVGQAYARRIAERTRRGISALAAI